MSTTPPTAAGPSAAELSSLFAEQQAHRPVVKATGARERIGKLDRIIAYLDDSGNRDRLLLALRSDLGKHEVEALTGELGVVYGHVNHIKKELRRWMEPRRMPTPLSMTGTRNWIHYEPKGCVLLISPWNYPFNLTVVPLAYAIAAGCTVTVKPSELSPATSAYLADMLGEIFPREEITVVTGEGDTAAALTILPFDHLFFTGSPAVGKKVMAAAASNLTSVTLELGGKSPCVVDRSVDIEKSAVNTAWGKCFNTGQTCTAPDYLLVHRSIADRYVAALGAAMEGFYGADPRRSDSLGRIVTHRHFDRLLSLLNDAVEQGATVAYGGQHDRSEKYFAPTILTGVTEDMRIMREEIFGPLLPVLAFDRLEEAIGVINRRPKPLAFYIQSRDRKVMKELIRRTSAGGTVINEFLLGNANPALPFGGVNNSGIGKSFGYHGWVDFCNERAVLERRFLDLTMVYPPYTDKVAAIARKIYKWL